MLEYAEDLQETPEWLAEAVKQLQARLANAPEDVALEYMTERCNQIIDAAAPFLSFDMLTRTLNLPGDTPVRISVECQNAYSKTITLTDWRKLFIMAGINYE